VTSALLDAPGLPLGAETDPTPTPEASRGRLRRFWFVPAGVALLGAAALVPSVGGSGPGAGEARLSVDGVAVVTDDDGGTTTVRDDRIDVGPGDRVAITEGRGVFEMAGDVRLEGLGAGEDGAGTTIEMAVAPRLVEGPLLVDAPTPLEIEATAATVTVQARGAASGAARLERGIGLTVGTYRGRVTVESAGRQGEVPRYRRAEIAAPGALGPDDLPLRYDANDPWDRRYLADGLVIDAQVGPLLASLGDSGRASFLDASTLRRAMPGLPASGLGERLEEITDGGDALVLAAIAVAVDDRSFTTAWDSARSFQGVGAGWGLVSLDQGVRSSQVLPAIRSALDTLDLTAALSEDADGDGTTADRADTGDADGAGGAEGGDPTGPDGGAGGSDGPGGPEGVTDPGEGGGGGLPPDVPGVTIPPTTVPDVPLPTLPEPPDVGGTVGGVVDGVTDGVDGVAPGVGGTVDGVVDGVGGVVDGLGGAVGGLGGAVGGAGGAVGGALGGVVGGLGGAVSGVGIGLGGSSGGG
jgi:hypothetical protein